jgi:spermidine synthase
MSTTLSGHRAGARTTAPPGVAPPPGWLVPALALLFLLSGMSGLIYQTLWQRLLSLVFGVTVYATATVLASFMGGLALGSLAAGRLALRARRPLVLFGIIEILIALTALATPFALDLVAAIYIRLHALLPDALAPLTVARFVCSFVVLLIPTMLMGATLPLVVASSLGRGTVLGPKVGLLYASNTGGAITGALLAGFVLIGGIGIQRSFLTAAAVNTLVGIAALCLARRATHAAVAEPGSLPAPAGGDADPFWPRERERRVLLIVFALSGFAALALEVVWFRVLVLVVPATTYAFTVMLATVLAGIAIGSAIVTPLLRRDRDWTTTLAVLQACIGLVAVVSFWMLLVGYRGEWFRANPQSVSLITILPASLLMGAAFPIGIRLWAGHDGSAPGRSGRRVARLYAVNLAAAIAGPVVAGFLLIPRIGSAGSLVAISALYLASGLLLAASRSAPGPRRSLAFVAPLAVPFVVAALAIPDPFTTLLGRRVPPGERLFWHEEGVQTTVGVFSRPFSGRVLYLDGLHQANDSAPMVQLHRQIGLLPMAVHPDPQRALVVGLGGGVTAGAVSQHGGTNVTVVELSSSVVVAADWFRHVNYDVLRQPNVTMRVDDGRNYLLVSNQRYDVITADIIQPVHAGAGAVYSREYFELARDALAAGGVMLQWIGDRPETHYKLIMRTFLSVFPHVTLWSQGNLMIGSAVPHTISPESFALKLEDPRTRAAFREIGLERFDDLAGLYHAGDRELRAFVGEGPVLTDDRPLVEYHRSLPGNEPMIDTTGLRGQVADIITPRRATR